MWVCILLKVIFQSRYANSIIFKASTSLSKANDLIDRFSEDIDFIIDEFREELIQQLDQLGISKELYEIKYNEHVDDTSDPNTLEIYSNL